MTNAALVRELRLLAAQATVLAEGLETPAPGRELWPADVMERLVDLSTLAGRLAREHRWSDRR